MKHILFDYRETLSIHRKTISEPLKLLHQHLFLSKQTTLPHFITFNIYEVLTKIWREWMLNTQCTLLSTISNEDIKVRASSNFFPTFNKFFLIYMYHYLELMFIFHYFSVSLVQMAVATDKMFRVIYPIVYLIFVCSYFLNYIN